MNSHLVRKYLFTLTLLLLSACNNKSDFDLLNINFQKNNVFTLVKGEKHATYPGYISTDSKNLLFFNGESLYKKRSGMGNFLTLYYNDKSKNVYFYSIKLRDIEIGKSLLKSLEKRFGKADYTGYEGGPRTVVDFNNTKPNKYIWEDKKDNRLFILGFQGTSQTYLNVMVQPTRSEDIMGMAGADYWNDFVDARSRNHDANYTYSQFIEDKMKSAVPGIVTRLTRGKSAK